MGQRWIMQSKGRAEEKVNFPVCSSCLMLGSFPELPPGKKQTAWIQGGWHFATYKQLHTYYLIFCTMTSVIIVMLISEMRKQKHTGLCKLLRVTQLASCIAGTANHFFLTPNSRFLPKWNYSSIFRQDSRVSRVLKHGEATIIIKVNANF